MEKKNIYVSLVVVILVIIAFVVFSGKPKGVEESTLTAAPAEKCFFPARTQHTSVVFNNKMWVIGGVTTGGSLLNDVWSSSTGQFNNWSKVTTTIPWLGRYQHASTVFNNKMWVMGGLAANAGYKNDVWSSIDGSNWVQMTPNAGWSPRANLALVTFNNKMWVIGGVDGVSIAPANQVWWSIDGATWTQAPNLPAAMFYVKNKSDVMVIGNSMVVRPSDTSNFWSSSDGNTWTQIATNTPVIARTGTASTVFNNVGWILGGMNSYNLSLFKDVWSSPTGATWTQVTNNANWSAR